MSSPPNSYGQAHVHGPPDRLRSWCDRQGVPLRVFPWRNAFGEARLARDAAYLIRPDGYVGIAEPDGRAGPS